MIFCAGGLENFNFARPLGIGLIDATATLTKICMFDRPDNILFVGSAGSYGNHDIYDIVHSDTATNIEIGYFENRSYTPVDNIVKATTHNTTTKTIVNSSNYITTDKSTSDEFLSRGIELENMEFYAVLKVAKLFDISASGLFVVTNYTNSEAHNMFQTNHKTAIQKLETYLKGQV
jgi:nucleoside phosphorylase